MSILLKLAREAKTVVESNTRSTYFKDADTKVINVLAIVSSGTILIGAIAVVLNGMDKRLKRMEGCLCPEDKDYREGKKGGGKSIDL